MEKQFMSQLNIIDELLELKQFVRDRGCANKAAFNVMNGCLVTHYTEVKPGFTKTPVPEYLMLTWQRSSLETREHALRISNVKDALKYLEAMKKQSDSLGMSNL